MAESPRQDSLRTVAHIHSGDSTGMDAMLKLMGSYLRTNLDSSLAIGERAQNIAKSAENKHFLAETENLLGIARLYQGSNSEALVHFEAVLTIRKNMDQPKKVASAHNNVALAHQELGNYSVALDHHIQSLKIKEDLHDSLAMRYSYNNVGLIYEHLQDFVTARIYYRKALHVQSLAQDSNAYATSLYNIGVTYLEQNQNDSAQATFERSMPLVMGLGDQRMIGMHDLSFGVLDQRAGRFDEAHEKFIKALDIFKELGKKDQIVSAWVNLGLNYLKDGNPRQALFYCKKGWDWAEEKGTLEKQVDCLGCLHQSYEAIGQGQEAYKMALKYYAYRDSLRSGNALKQIMRKDIDYSYTKAQLADSLETARQQELVKVEYENQLSRQRVITLFLVITGVLLLGFAILYYLNFRNKARQSVILEARVQKRTETLQQQKDQLAEYAFMNAHLLRQPLTQILGLIPLIQTAQSQEERDEYINLLQRSSEKLDRVIHEIRDVVEKEQQI